MLRVSKNVPTSRGTKLRKHEKKILLPYSSLGHLYTLTLIFFLFSNLSLNFFQFFHHSIGKWFRRGCTFVLDNDKVLQWNTQLVERDCINTVFKFTEKKPRFYSNWLLYVLRYIYKPSKSRLYFVFYSIIFNKS